MVRQHPLAPADLPRRQTPGFALRAPFHPALIADRPRPYVLRFLRAVSGGLAEREEAKAQLVRLAPFNRRIVYISVWQPSLVLSRCVGCTNASSPLHRTHCDTASYSERLKGRFSYGCLIIAGADKEISNNLHPHRSAQHILSHPLATTDLEVALQFLRVLER